MHKKVFSTKTIKSFLSEEPLPGSALHPHGGAGFIKNSLLEGGKVLCAKCVENFLPFTSIDTFLC